MQLKATLSPGYTWSNTECRVGHVREPRLVCLSYSRTPLAAAFGAVTSVCAAYLFFGEVTEDHTWCGRRGEHVAFRGTEPT